MAARNTNSQLFLGCRRRHATASARPGIPGLGHDQRAMAPLWTWPTAFRNCASARVWKSTRNTSSLPWRAFPARQSAATGASTAIGLARYTCLPRPRRRRPAAGESRAGFQSPPHPAAIEQALVAGQAGVTARGFDLMLFAHRSNLVLEVIGAGRQAIPCRNRRTGWRSNCRARRSQ